MSEQFITIPKIDLASTGLEARDIVTYAYLKRHYNHETNIRLEGKLGKIFVIPDYYYISSKTYRTFFEVLRTFFKVLRIYFEVIRTFFVRSAVS